MAAVSFPLLSVRERGAGEQGCHMPAQIRQVIHRPREEGMGGEGKRKGEERGIESENGGSVGIKKKKKRAHSGKK